MKELEKKPQTPCNPFNPMDAQPNKIHDPDKRLHSLKNRSAVAYPQKPKPYAYVVDWQIEE